MASPSIQFRDVDANSLGALLDVFGSFCSLEEIASAYCRSKGDVTVAGNMLCQVQDSKYQGSANEERENKSQGSVDEPSRKVGTAEQETGMCEISTEAETRTKMSISKKASASVGTVSSILGSSYMRPSYPAKETFEKAKPTKIEIEKSVIDALDVEPGSSAFEGSKRESLSNREIEQFLFSILADGFKLSRDVIREVLGSCGYDIRKSMEELLDFSTKSLKKDKAIDDNDATIEYKQSSGPSSQEVGISVENTSSRQSNSSCAKGNLKNYSDVSQQLLQSIFTVPERVEEEPFKPRFDLGVNRLRSSSQTVVSKPPEDIKMPMPVFDLLRNQLEQMETDPEDDEYIYLRDVTKKYWDSMKEYYGEAVAAFISGDHQRTNYLLEQGKRYFKLARESEEKSARHPAGLKKEDEEICLDLRVDDSKDALYLLKMHICKLVNIPNLLYLKVIVEPETEDPKRMKIRRKVLRLLQKESIQWKESEANRGTLSIRLDQIDHSKLSFAKKFTDTEV